MSGGGGVIIICSSAGVEFGDKSIVVYDGSVLSLGIKLDTDAMQTYPGVSHRDAARVRRMLDRFYEDLHAELTRLGIPNVEHEPHAQP